MSVSWSVGDMYGRGGGRQVKRLKEEKRMRWKKVGGRREGWSSDKM